MKRLRILLFTLLSCCWLPAAAQEEPEPPVEDTAQSGTDQADAPPAIDRRQAARLVSEEYAGRVLGVRLEGRRWHVRVDNEGTVFTVFVDAMTGDLSLPEE